MVTYGGINLNPKNNSRNIPEDIKRKVRQRCGFGCVICGNPIYDYEHMNQWAIVREHVTEDITLLCPSHHREKTVGRLPLEMVKKADSMPYNIKHGRSNSMELYFSGNSCTFFFGGNSFSMDSHKIYPSILIPLMVDEVALFSFVLLGRKLMLNANIFDEDNNLILKIVNNNLVYSVDNWDITFIGKNLTIRQDLSKILLNISFETPNKVKINRARLFYNGKEISVFKDKILINNNNTQIIRSKFINFPVGITIGNVKLPTAFSV